MSNIPTTIHYCWFGGNPLGPDELRCIESWKKFLPDYEIKRWDESNFDVNCCDYVAEAYNHQKWAFVSDYARFDILYRNGGLYFDTDVELVRPIDDLIETGSFMGFELDYQEGIRRIDAPGFGPTVNPGLGMSAVPGLELFGDLLNSYKKDHFIKNDGSLNLETVVTRTTDILTARGLLPRPGIQVIDGISIYPAEFFNPKDFWSGDINITDNTRAIHHFGMSWYSEVDKYQHQIESYLSKYLKKQKYSHRLAMLAAAIKFRDFTMVRDFFRRKFTKQG